MKQPLAPLIGLAVCMICSPYVLANPGDAAHPDASPGSTDAGSPDEPGDALFERWTTYQYIVGEPERAPEMIGRFVEHVLPNADEDSDSVTVMSVFLAQLGRTHPALLDDWADAAAEMGPVGKYLVSSAVWFAEPDACAPRIRRIVADLPEDDDQREALLSVIGQEPPDFKSFGPVSPGMLDWWWVSFLATGDTEYVGLVMTALPPKPILYEDAEFDGDIMRLAIGGAATWSLRSNAYQHPRVLAYLKERRADEPGPWPELDEIIRDAEEELEKAPSPAPTPDSSKAPETQDTEPRPVTKP